MLRVLDYGFYILAVLLGLVAWYLVYIDHPASTVWAVVPGWLVAASWIARSIRNKDRSTLHISIVSFSISAILFLAALRHLYR